jgi:hypothetical protein
MGGRCAAYNGFENHATTCVIGAIKVKIVFVSFDF